MKYQAKVFVGTTLIIFLIGLLPSILFFSASSYFRGFASRTDSWQCSCGAIQFITHPRSDILATGTLILGGMWLIWLIVSAAHILSRQVTQITPIRRNILRTEVMNGVPIEILDTDTPTAMTVGVFRPKILLSKMIETTLTAEERQAVLAHELHHAQRYDPLWTLVVSVIGRAYGHSSFIQELIERWTVVREVTADQAATNDYTDRRGLAGALLKMSTSGIEAVPAFSPNLIRIDTLLHPESALPKFIWKQLVLGLGIACLAMYIGIRAGTAWAAEPTQREIQQCHEIHQMCQRVEVQSLLLFTPRTFTSYEIR